MRGGSTAGTALAPRDPNPDPDPDQQLALLTVNDVAKLFAVNKDWIYDQAESGALPSIKLGRRQLRFRRSDLEAWLEARQRDSAG